MPRQRLWKPFILLASLVFYGWWDWRFVLLLALSAVANQLLAKAIERCGDGRGPQVAAGRGRRREPRRPGLVQVLRVLRHLRRQLPAAPSTSTPTCRCCASCCRSASRSSPSACSATSSTSTAGSCSTSSLLDFAVYVAFFPYIARRADRARQRVPAPAGRAPGPAQRRHVPGLLPDLRRARQEDAARRLPGHAHRQRRVHDARLVHVARDARRHRRLLGADLLRLQRLRGHRHRRLAAPRLRAARQLRRPVHRRLGAGLLAALAHDAVALAARLPLHPAGRQPQGADPHLREPDPHHGARRPLARRRLDLRVLGRAARRRTGGGAPPHRRAQGALRAPAAPARARRRGGRHRGTQLRRHRAGSGLHRLRLRRSGSGRCDRGRRADALGRGRQSGGPLVGAPRGAPLELDPRPWGGGVWPRVGTFAFVTFAWVFFRSATLRRGAQRARAAVPRLGQHRRRRDAGAPPRDRRRHRHPVRAAQRFTERVEAGFSVLNPLAAGPRCSPSASCCSTSSAPPAPPPSSTSGSDGRARHGRTAVRPPPPDRRQRPRRHRRGARPRRASSTPRR